MRIVLIHNYYQYRGGEESYVNSLVALLKKDGHDVFLYTKDSRNISGTMEKIQIVFNLLFGHRTKRELKSILKTFKPDIVHLNNIYPLIGQSAYDVCAQFSIPIVQTVHNYRPMCIKGHLFRNNKICELCIKSSRWNGVRFKCFQNSYIASFFLSFHMLIHMHLYKTYNKIDAFIFPSEFTRKYFLDHINTPESKTHILAHYVNEISPIKTASLSQNAYFLFFGRLSEEKGVKEIIKVFEELPKIILTIAGNGPLKEFVLKKTEEHKNILYIGQKSKKDLISLIKNSEAVIINSLWYEVLPFSMLETIQLGSNILMRKNKNSNLFMVNKNCLFTSHHELRKKIIKISKHKTHAYREPFHNELRQDYYRNELLKLYANIQK